MSRMGENSKNIENISSISRMNENDRLELLIKSNII